MKPIIIIAAVLGLTVLSGCQAIARGAAEDPYRKAMLDGRMSPSEYKQKVDEIRKASEPMK